MNIIDFLKILRYTPIVNIKYKGCKMSNKVRPTDISNRFNIPVQTATNWSKAKGSWRYTLYIELSKVYAEGVVSENIKLSDEEKKIEWGVKK